MHRLCISSWVWLIVDLISSVFEWDQVLFSCRLWITWRTWITGVRRTRATEAGDPTPCGWGACVREHLHILNLCTGELNDHTKQTMWSFSLANVGDVPLKSVNASAFRWDDGVFRLLLPDRLQHSQHLIRPIRLINTSFTLHHLLYQRKETHSLMDTRCFLNDTEFTVGSHSDTRFPEKIAILFSKSLKIKFILWINLRVALIPKWTRRTKMWWKVKNRRNARSCPAASGGQSWRPWLAG